MHASRVACVGRVRWIALGAVLVAGAAGVASLRAGPETEPPSFTCTVPQIAAAPPPAIEEPEPEHPVCPAIIDGRFTTEQLRTLELARRLYSDEQCRYPFELLATPEQGELTAVVVKRSTGDCGGCGGLAVAAVFERGTLTTIGELGRYGRMGNGPDGARWVTVAGEPALELAWSESNHGYTHDYREVFTREGDRFQRGPCLETGFDDEGARERPTAWRARLDYRADATIRIHYDALRTGESPMPDLTTTFVAFDRAKRQWSVDTSGDGCVTPPDPHTDDVLLHAPGD